MANKITVEFSSRGADQLKKKVDDLYISQVRLQKGHKAATAALAKLNTETVKHSRVGALSTKTTRIQTGAFATMRSQLLLASFAFGLVNASILKLGRAFGEQEQAEKRLEHVIGKSSASLKAKASELQKVTRFGDEETLAAMTLVGAYTTNEQAIASLTEAAQDLATVKGMDLKTATDMLSKSVFSSTNSMQRYGIEIDGVAGTSNRLNSALKAVSTQMGGAAVEDAKTFLGALDQMGDAVGDVGEDLGEALAPAIVAVAKAVKSFAEALDADHVEKFLSVLAGAGTVWLAYTISTRLATTATMLFTKATRKNIALLAAMLIVSKVIDHMDLFAVSTDSLDDEIKKLNEDLKAHQNLAKSDIEMKKAMLETSHKEAMATSALDAAINKKNEAMKEGIHANFQAIESSLELALVAQEIEYLQELELKGLVSINEQKEHKLKLDGLILKQTNMQAVAELKAANDKEKAGNKMLDVASKVNEAFNTNAESMKNIQFALAMIDAYKQYTATKLLLTEGDVPPVVSHLVALAEAAVSVSYANKIRNQEIPKGAYGGLIGGNRHSQGGTIIEAEQGEFLMSRDAVDSIGIGSLQAMNRGGGGAGVTINISGNVMSEDFVETELADKIQEAVRKGVNFGMS